jgi:large subunit ribosomal protein L9
MEKLGQMGDVVQVKPGFARNFLLPKRKAMLATKDNLKYFEKARIQLEAINLQRRSEAETVAAKMQSTSIIILRQAGDSSQLYGSVSARDIAEELTAAGYTVSRNQVVIDRPIKNLGIFELQIQLHPEVQAEVIVNVARSADEAVLQAQRSKSRTPETLEPRVDLEDTEIAESDG